MAEVGLVVGAAGNVSVRVPRDSGDDLMAITPTGVPCAGVTADDIVITDLGVEPVEGELVPSSESLLHTGIYRARPDVQAVMHTHPVYSSVLAVLGIDLPPVIDEVAVYVGGAVRVSEYAFPGSEELSANVLAALASRKAAFIANHGAVAVGKSLDEALDICMLVERTSRIYVTARMIGSVKEIPDEYIEAETAIYAMRNLDLGGL